jgi:hypothetical protein
MATIKITKIVKQRLSKYGVKGSTWDSILNDLMNHAEKCDRFWEDRYER